MRRVALFAVTVLFLGCGEALPDVQEAAVNVKATYDFKAGCIVVVARDTAAEDKVDRAEVPVLGRATPTVNIAVYRRADWGRTVEITVAAHEQVLGASEEQQCTGRQVVTETREFTLDKPGKQSMEVSLSAQDGDGDGWVATPIGSDCDDRASTTRPGASEVCDGFDNDCRNGIDDGLTQNDYYLDADDDGVGAGPVVKACQPPPDHVTSSNDCDDGNGARTPGKSEVCDGFDNDCDATADEGVKTTFYRDGDNDGAGRSSETMDACSAPTGFAPLGAGFDCDDGVPTVKPGAPERCNGVDDNCVGGVDEGFANRPGNSCSQDICTGTFVCNATQDDTVCSAPMPVNTYPDADGDMEGAMAGPVEKICPPAMPAAGRVINNTDCNDSDPHNKAGGTEICDDRDNNCSGNDAEEDGPTGVCGGKGWRSVADTAVTGSNWNTVAMQSGTGAVWIAGDSGAVAVRPMATAPFENRTAMCGGTTNWRAAWVRPSDGQVYLAGEGGNLATISPGGTCVTNTTSNASSNPSTRALTGIVGFEAASTTVYVVNDEGRVYAWTPPSIPVYKTFRDGTAFRSIHGLAATRLIFGGNNSSNNDPRISSYDGTLGEGATTDHTVNDGPTNGASIRAVWLMSNTQGYAVGQKGLFLRWDGNMTWDYASPNSALMADFTSVVALDDASVYVTDDANKIRRAGTTSWIDHHTAPGLLLDIAAVRRPTTQLDIWAVGPSGLVVHFPEPPPASP
jgi:hypothetical protein